MIEFDLENSNILVDEIDSVHLSMNVFFSKIKGHHVCSLHTINIEWNEAEVTWLQADSNTSWLMVPQTMNDDTFALKSAGDIDIDPIATTMSDTVGFWQHWNVTETIKRFIENPDTNHGLMVRTSAELQPHYYYSSEHDSVELRPKLTFYMNGVSNLIEDKNKKYLDNMMISVKNQNLIFKFDKYSDSKIELFNSKGQILLIKSLLGIKKFHYNLADLPNGKIFGRIETGSGVQHFSIANIK